MRGIVLAAVHRDVCREAYAGTRRILAARASTACCADQDAQHGRNARTTRWKSCCMEHVSSGSPYGFTDSDCMPTELSDEAVGPTSGRMLQPQRNREYWVRGRLKPCVEGDREALPPGENGVSAFR